jgi:hypothetical protein
VFLGPRGGESAGQAVKEQATRRPWSITGLAVFFGAGALISAISCAALLFPGGVLEPMWRLNPRAHEAFGRMGSVRILLLVTVGITCAFSAVGFWNGREWGYRLGVALLVVNLVGDITNAALGVEPRAIWGVPVVLSILAYLGTSRGRAYFSGATRL